MEYKKQTNKKKQPFKGNHIADVTQRESEFGNPGLIAFQIHKIMYVNLVLIKTRPLDLTSSTNKVTR